MPTSGLELLEKQVPRRIRELGRHYLELNAVRILFADGEFVSAQIMGTRRYNVDLERDGGNLVCSCDCSRFNDDFEVCTHIWAALLALEKSGGLKKWEENFP
ncbi:MAG: hypothetical protein LBP68_07415, partial [Acidobacteriota bacterium]|nr:hypothetical protein [Acidobacteriota bacterium]